MSGHSKWSQIKHKKGITDAKKSKIFSKISKTITVAVRLGGPNKETNPKLSLAIEKAKSVNMPNENIERAIKRATGAKEKDQLEELVIEAFGPYGVAIILEAISDNKNRTLSEIRQILSKHNAKLANEGSVKWLFNFYGKIIIPINSYKFEDLETLAIELDSLDIYKTPDEENVIILTRPEDFNRIKKEIEKQKIQIKEAGFEYIPKNPIKLSDSQKQELEQLFNELDENDSVQEIYSNLEN